MRTAAKPARQSRSVPDRPGEARAAKTEVAAATGDKYAKQTQFGPGRIGNGRAAAGQSRETNPIWRRIVRNKPNFRPWRVGQGLGDEERTWKTNPIPGLRDTPPFHYSIIPPFPRDADCAKQTQFRQLGQGSGTRDEYASCTNKANLPIGTETGVRNKANSPEGSEKDK